MPAPPGYDVVVVGSGFGGSVAALRLSEKGYRVAVLEAGRRYGPAELPRTSWEVRRFLWAPRLGCFGVQRAHFLPDVVVLAGAGVGGGSLNYAGTLYEPLEGFFEDPQWPGLPGRAGGAGSRGAAWREELRPFYDQARRMLGVTANPAATPADEAMRRVADAMGAGATFRPTPVGVFFGPPGTPAGTELPDPYFGGAGPARRTCTQCGECMTGCRWGAKNTLVTNYLRLAERAGARVLPSTTVTGLAPLAGGGWEIETERTTSGWPRRRRHFQAGQVVLAAGAYGSQRLLHTMVARGRLPRLSPRLGHLTRTNSESLVGAVVPRHRAHPDYSRGVAITSSFYPAPGTHVEPVRYGRGSNLMGLLGTLLVEGLPERGARPARAAALGRLAATALGNPREFLACFDLRGWSERTVIALVMQSGDGSLTVAAERGRWGRVRLTSHRDGGPPTPAWLPVAHEVARRLAATVGGRPAGNWGEAVAAPMTAHFLGGCVVGSSPEDGVVDAWHRAFGYEGLHVVDGSALPANPGANPSLTITAMAERAFSYWPNRGEPDARPAPGTGPAAGGPAPARVRPRWPAVPAGAPAELAGRVGP